MRSFLARTASVPAFQPFISSSSKHSIPRHDSFHGYPITGETMASGKADKNRVYLQLDSGGKRGPSLPTGIRRVLSESDVIRSWNEASPVHAKSNANGSRDLPEKIPEEGFGPNNGDPSVNFLVGSWPVNGMSLETLGFTGNGTGNGGGRGVDSDTGGNGGEPNKMVAYYEELSKSNPNDSLVLGNYGKFLLEVEKDTEKAEEYYGRAILANPGDAELLSHYGKLIWDKDRDEERAKSYFDRAIYASPDDCMALGSYASFMWEVEEEEDVAKHMANNQAEFVAAF